MKKINADKCLVLTQLSVFFSLVVFILNPLITLSQQNIGDIMFSMANFLGDMVVLSLIAFFFTVCLTVALAVVFGYSVTCNLFIFGCIYISLCSVNPISAEANANMNGLNHKIDIYSFFMNLISSVGIFYIIRGNFKLKRYVSVGMCLSILLAGSAGLKKFSSQKTAFDLQFGKQNLVVFSFDGIPGITLNEIAFNAPEFSDTFKDFTLYENTVSHSPATFASIFSEIFGANNWKNVASTDDDLIYLKNKIINSEKTWYLEEAVHYGSYTKFRRSNNMLSYAHNSHGVLQDKQTYAPMHSRGLISSSICRFGFCVFGEKYGDFNNYIMKFIHLMGFNYYGSNYIHDYETLGYILNNLNKTEKDFGAFFGHFIFSHHPIAHDENCHFISNLLIKSEARVKDQVTCIIKTMRRIINELKRKKLYESSLLVFKSDHGKPSDYFNKRTVRGGTILHEDNIFGYDRYRPFVMLKLPHQQNEKTIFNKNIFYLSDLSNIYCESYKFFSNVPDRSCNSLQKFLDDEYKLKDDGSNYLYVPKNMKTHRFNGHTAIKNPDSIKGMEDMFKLWSLD